MLQLAAVSVTCQKTRMPVKQPDTCQVYQDAAGERLGFKSFQSFISRHATGEGTWTPFNNQVNRERNGILKIVYLHLRQYLRKRANLNEKKKKSMGNENPAIPPYSESPDICRVLSALSSTAFIPLHDSTLRFALSRTNILLHVYLITLAHMQIDCTFDLRTRCAESPSTSHYNV